MLFWLDFICDNLVHPCNTPTNVLNSALYRSFQGDAVSLHVGTEEPVLEVLPLHHRRPPLASPGLAGSHVRAGETSGSGH
jgi:hypothetical protein